MPLHTYLPALITLACLALPASLAHAQEMLSVNFLLSGEQQEITGSESFGLANYDGSGTSTVTTQWNNVVGSPESPGDDPLNHTTTATGLIDNNAVTTELVTTFFPLVDPTFGFGNNFIDEPGRCGVPVWNAYPLEGVLKIRDIYKYTDRYDLILYFGLNNNSNFQTGEVSINGEIHQLTPTKLYAVATNLDTNGVTINLTNTTGTTSDGINNKGIFLGGYQLIKKGNPVDLSGKPNVILIVCDDLNADVQGFGGHPQVITPKLDEFRNESLVFQQAHCPSPICAPSRASFMTGIYPHTSGNFGFDNWMSNSVLANSHSIHTYLRSNGYYVAGTGKLHHTQYTETWDEYHEKADYGPYISDGITEHHLAATDPAYIGRFEQFAHPLTPAPYSTVGGIDGSYGPLIPVEGVDFGDGKSYHWRTGSWARDDVLRVDSVTDRDLTADEDNGAWAVSKIQEFATDGSDSPFFLAVGFVRPHTPLIVDQQFFNQYPLETIEFMGEVIQQGLEVPAQALLDTDHLDTYLANAQADGTGKRLFDLLVESYGGDREEALKHFIQAYLACVTSVDQLIGNILDEVKSHPEIANNTIIIITSDHGWHNGEKNLLHKNTLWEVCTRVPLMIKVPGMTPATGGESSHPVSLVDLFPTIADLCSITSDNRKNAGGALLDGHSLRPFLEDPAATSWSGPSSALTAIYRWGVNDKERVSYALRDRDYRYIRYHTGQKELYHTSSDPNEYTNLADDPAYAGLIQQYDTELKQRVGFPEYTSMAHHFAFLQDFEDESGLLTLSNRMSFGETVQTDANGDANKGNLVAMNYLGSQRLVTMPMNGFESSQFRVDAINGESYYTLGFDFTVDNVTDAHQFELRFYGTDSEDFIRINTNGTNNIEFNNSTDGSVQQFGSFVFSANTVHRFKLTYTGGQFDLLIDDISVLSGLQSLANPTNLRFLTNDTGANPAPILSFDNVIVLYNQNTGLIDFLVSEELSLTTNLFVEGASGQTLIEKYAFNGATPITYGLPGTEIGMRFYADADGATYKVLYSDDLTNWMDLPASMMTKTPAGNMEIDYSLPPGDDKVFFKVEVGLE